MHGWSGTDQNIEKVGLLNVTNARCPSKHSIKWRCTQKNIRKKENFNALNVTRSLNALALGGVTQKLTPIKEISNVMIVINLSKEKVV